VVLHRIRHPAIEVQEIRPRKRDEQDDAGRDDEALASYALFQEKGAYWPLFLPVTSSHARPSACTWLFEACASVNVSAAGWPVCSSRNSASGFNPLAPVAAMSTNVDAFTDHFAPCRSKAIAADSMPRNLPM